MAFFCPDCSSPIPLEDLNVSTDLALCRRCGKHFRLSELDGLEPVASFDPHDPPRGTWFEETIDGWRFGAAVRGWLGWFLLLFSLMWSGITVGGFYGPQIAVRGREVEVFSGALGIGRRWRFTVDEVRGIMREGGLGQASGERVQPRIRVEVPRPFSFGSFLCDARFHYVMNTLRSAIAAARRGR